MATGFGNGGAAEDDDPAGSGPDLELPVRIGCHPRDAEQRSATRLGRTVREPHADARGRVGDRDDRWRTHPPCLRGHDTDDRDDRADRPGSRVRDARSRGGRRKRGRRRSGRRRRRRRREPGKATPTIRGRDPASATDDGEGDGAGRIASSPARVALIRYPPLPGPRAVALPDRPDDDDGRSRRDRGRPERVRPEDHADRAGAVVDEDPQSIGERGRASGRAPAYPYPNALQVLADRSGRGRDGHRKVGRPEFDDVPDAYADRPGAIALVDRSGEAHLVTGRPRCGTVASR